MARVGGGHKEEAEEEETKKHSIKLNPFKGAKSKRVSDTKRLHDRITFKTFEGSAGIRSNLCSESCATA